MAGNMTLAGNSDFKSWVSQLKQDIRSAQIKAAIKVNTELLRLYWRMGADISEKQKSSTLGDGWLKELSRELMAEFPDMKGFSYRNLQYIRQWYLFYNQGNIIVQQVVAQLQERFWQQPVAKISEDIFFSVPWGHQLYIISKPTDTPTIGLLICKTKNNVMAQYALESTNQPIGISEYQLSKLMPENIQSQLPTIEYIEATLSAIKETKN